jgi:hypothetical protein
MPRIIAVIVAGPFVALAAAVVQTAVQTAPTAATSMIVYKSPTCGCCLGWMRHLRDRGFRVESTDFSDAQLRVVKIEEGVPGNLQTCHTGRIGGYLVEGHVPAADIQRLLTEKPPIAGIAVGGMPVGSPGMEQGARRDPYNTIAFTKDGKQTVFAKH